MRSWQTIAYELPMTLPLPKSIPGSLTWHRFFGFVYLHPLFTSTSNHSYPLLRCAQFTQLQTILNIKFCLFSYCCVRAHTHAHIDGVPWGACGGQRVMLRSSFQTHITSKDYCFKNHSPWCIVAYEKCCKVDISNSSAWSNSTTNFVGVVPNKLK